MCIPVILITSEEQNNEKSLNLEFLIKNISIIKKLGM